MPAGTIVSSGALVSPGGQQGLTGPTAAVSTDAGNQATLGSDSRIYVPAVPPGVIWEYGGSTAPAGFVMCDGTSYPTATYPGLFGAIGYTYGGSGANFNVPDKRSRSSIGAGQGTGLTNRLLGTTGGEENHALVTGELATHNHTASQGTSTASQAASSASQGTHTHTDNGHNHTINQLQSTNGQSGSGISYFWQNATNPYGSNTGYANIAAASAGAITVNNGAITVSNGAITIGNNGSGTGHNNMQPFLVTNFIIKT